MRGVKKLSWCDLPDRKYARELEDLHRMKERCDAWTAFFSSETLKRLKRLKGWFLWFNKHQYFDRLIMEFEVSEKRLRGVLKQLLLPAYQTISYEFKRDDIYDARAWCYIPLSCFVNAPGFNGREGIKGSGWDFEVLKKHEIPIVQLGIKKHWEVSRKSFTLQHRLRNGMRFAEMIFSHPDLDARFKNRRWVADREFPPETTRKVMEVALFEEIERKCKDHLVTICD